jgi:hypothetical protein
MKQLFFLSHLFSIFIFISACQKPTPTPAKVSFNKGVGYIFNNDTMLRNSPILIGINAITSQSDNLMKTFTITRTTNDDPPKTIAITGLGGAEASVYSFNLNTNVDSTVGNSNKYLFSITDKAGLTSSVQLTIVSK